MSFSKVLGHGRQKDYLKECLKNSKIFQSLVFAGVSGTGKKLIAKEFAKALHCQNLNQETLEPCDKCVNCSQHNNGAHPDLTLCDFNYQASLGKTEAERDPCQQQVIKVDTVRQLCLTAQQRPVLGAWQIIILDHAEKLNRNAANALLKMLEEPPKKTLWILISESGESLLPTIKSRSQIINFPPLTAKQISQILEQKGFGAKSAAFYAGLSNGSVGKAVEVKEFIDGISDINVNSPVFEFEVSKTFSKTLAVARREAGLCIELLIINASNKWQQLQRPAQKEQISVLINKLFTCKNYLRRNVSPALTAELALMQAKAAGINFPSEKEF